MEGAILVCGRARGSGVGRWPLLWGRRRGDQRTVYSVNIVVAVLVVLRALCWRRRDHVGNPRSVSFWSAVATSTGAIPFLKAYVASPGPPTCSGWKLMILRIGWWQRSGIVFFLKTPTWSPWCPTLRRLCGGGCGVFLAEACRLVRLSMHRHELYGEQLPAGVRHLLSGDSGFLLWLRF